MQYINLVFKIDLRQIHRIGNESVVLWMARINLTIEYRTGSARLDTMEYYIDNEHDYRFDAVAYGIRRILKNIPDTFRHKVVTTAKNYVYTEETPVCFMLDVGEDSETYVGIIQEHFLARFKNLLR